MVWNLKRIGNTSDASTRRPLHRFLSPAYLDRFSRLSRTCCRHLRHISLRRRADVQLLPDFPIHLGKDVLVLLEKIACILASLADPLARIAVPRARFLHDIVGHCEVENVALTADPFPV